MKKYNVAIVGATGLVGSTFIKVLEEYNFPINELRPLASSRSAGKIIKYAGKDIMVQELTKDSFQGIDIALFSASGSVSTEFSPIAAKAGAVSGGTAGQRLGRTAAAHQSGRTGQQHLKGLQLP